MEFYLYRGGLLHTKSIMVDGAMSMFGTVNLDMRSLWLNYEVALFVYDREFATQLRRLQQSYMDDSDRLDPEAWGSRSFGNRFLENPCACSARCSEPSAAAGLRISWDIRLNQAMPNHDPPEIDAAVIDAAVIGGGAAGLAASIFLGMCAALF